MSDLASALFGTAALVLTTLTALWFLKQGMARSEITDASRQRFAGCGIALLTLAVVGCVAAFLISANRLTTKPTPEPAPVILLDSKRP